MAKTNAERQAEHRRRRRDSCGGVVDLDSQTMIRLRWLSNATGQRAVDIVRRFIASEFARLDADPEAHKKANEAIMRKWKTDESLPSNDLFAAIIDNADDDV